MRPSYLMNHGSFDGELGKVFLSFPAHYRLHGLPVGDGEPQATGDWYTVVHVHLYTSIALDLG